MVLIICVDNNFGTMFNSRRQSQDKLLRERIIELSRKSKLWMNHYSEKQFEGHNILNLNVSDNFINEAQNGEFCFVEKENAANFEALVEIIVLYKWNCSYPFDETFAIDLKKWKCVETNDFEGSSHKKITEEIYVKNYEEI